MQRPATRGRGAARRGICLLAALLLSAPSARGGEWFELDEKALGNVNLQGLHLPASVAELHRQFPQATRDHQRVDDAIGLECYTAGELAGVDTARFYFCDGRMYQVELVYELPRVEQQGGMATLVEKLVEKWGPADHVGQSRWTWQRPLDARRADFYARPDAARLTITDTAWMGIVAERVKRAERRDRVELGR